MPPHARAVGPIPPGVDPDDYDRLRRRVLWAMPTGLYLMGSRAGGRRNLMTCNLVTQVATEPKLLGVGVEAGSVTLALVREGGSFTLSMLAHEDRAVVRTFAKPAVEDLEARTLSGVGFTDARVTGAPIPSLGVAWLDCRLDQCIELGSHALVIGEVVDAGPEGIGEIASVLASSDTRMHYGG